MPSAPRIGDIPPPRTACRVRTPGCNHTAGRHRCTRDRCQERRILRGRGCAVGPSVQRHRPRASRYLSCCRCALAAESRHETTTHTARRHQGRASKRRATNSEVHTASPISRQKNGLWHRQPGRGTGQGVARGAFMRWCAGEPLQVCDCGVGVTWTRRLLLPGFVAGSRTRDRVMSGRVQVTFRSASAPGHHEPGGDFGSGEPSHASRASSIRWRKNRGGFWSRNVCANSRPCSGPISRARQTISARIGGSATSGADSTLKRNTALKPLEPRRVLRTRPYGPVP